MSVALHHAVMLRKRIHFFFSVVSNAFAHKLIIKYLNKTTTPYNIVFRQPPHPSFFSP